MTNSQQRIVDRLLARYTDVAVQPIERTNKIIVKFNNGESHVLLRQCYILIVGPRGGIEVLMADRALTDSDKARKTMAYLALREADIWTRNVKFNLSTR